MSCMCSFVHEYVCVVLFLNGNLCMVPLWQVIWEFFPSPLCVHLTLKSTFTYLNIIIHILFSSQFLCSYITIQLTSSEEESITGRIQWKVKSLRSKGTRPWRREHHVCVTCIKNVQLKRLPSDNHSWGFWQMMNIICPQMKSQSLK